MHFSDYINEIHEFYRNSGLQIDPVPRLVLNNDEAGEFDPLIPTGNYNYSNNTITLYINGRHLKDILRTYCHELIHRNQYLTIGQDFVNLNKSGTLNENAELEELEGDAYRRGNIMFRRWTETKKRG